MVTKKQVQDAQTIRLFADVTYPYWKGDNVPAESAKIVFLFCKERFMDGKKWVLPRIRIYFYDKNDKLVKTMTESNGDFGKLMRFIPDDIMKDMAFTYQRHIGNDDEIYNDLKEIDAMRKARDTFHDKYDFENDWGGASGSEVRVSKRANFRYKLDNFSYESMDGKSINEQMEQLLGRKTSAPKRKISQGMPRINFRKMI